MNFAVRRLAVAAAAVVAVAGLSGCSIRTPEPTDFPSATSTTTTTPSSSRPRSIKLDGIDPCSLLPAQNKAQFGLDSPDVGIKTTPADAFNNAPRCLWSTIENSYSFVLVTSEGINTFTQGQASGKVSTAAPINGFPTLTIVPPISGQCFTAVDVAQGEMLVATILVVNAPTATMCDLVHQFAQVGMNSLASRN